ncbi:uncharacterized protein LOC126888196 [Diabrotica virgifera virgifera]|uniref:THAP-type domain-containing protein n=1 Tax=Diabrotica virgifera virgifera TaxID=50390 RepID=A0ABM5KPU9_DIAVI|nr:uncharacterized protein LOC126888196 [Diabrotica virgifera virgifera]
MPPISCCVKTCWKSPETKHRFPNPIKHKDLFDKWVSVIGNPELLEKTPEKVYVNSRVCAYHFAPGDFGRNNRLKWNVFPTVNLPDDARCLREVINIKSRHEEEINEFDRGKLEQTKVINIKSRHEEEINEFDRGKLEQTKVINIKSRHEEEINEQTNVIQENTKQIRQMEFLNNNIISLMNKLDDQTRTEFLTELHRLFETFHKKAKNITKKKRKSENQEHIPSKKRTY